MRAFIRLAAAALALASPAAAPAQTGVISGTAILEGPAPVAKMLTVTKNKDVCGETVRSRDIVVAGGKLAYAVASVEGLKGAVKPRTVLLSNAQCMFQPPYLAAAAGDTILVDNQDAVLHNTHLGLRLGARVRTMGNWGLSDKGSSIRAEGPLRLAGDLDVSCDAHPWMSAHITVFDHPYFAASDQAGHFEIKDVPAGTYTVKLRHPVLGELEQSVTVKPGATTTVTFSFPAARVPSKTE